MNIGLVEIAFSNVLKQELPTLTILKMRDDEDVPALTSFATVSVTNGEHVVGNLWKITVATEVYTPSPLLDIAGHNATVDSVCDIVENSTFATTYNETTPNLTHVCCGSKLISSEGAIEDNRFRHSLVILLGIESPISPAS